MQKWFRNLVTGNILSVTEESTAKTMLTRPDIYEELEERPPIPAPEPPPSPGPTPPPGEAFLTVKISNS